MGVCGGGSGTNPDTDTGTSTGTGTNTTPETGNDAVVAGKAPKQKRTRKPNELGIGQIVVTEILAGDASRCRLYPATRGPSTD
jgi:hypothetical protein